MELACELALVRLRERRPPGVTKFRGVRVRGLAFGSGGIPWGAHTWAGLSRLSPGEARFSVEKALPLNFGAYRERDGPQGRRFLGEFRHTTPARRGSRRRDLCEHRSEARA